MVIKMEITVDRTGLSIKVFIIIYYFTLAVGAAPLGAAAFGSF